MAGPNLEVFKFGCYVFFPILAMLKFGDPEWYDTYVKPYGAVIWPPYESTHKPPKTTTELQKEMERLRMQRQTRRGQTELTTLSTDTAQANQQSITIPTAANIPIRESAPERLV